MGLVLFGAVVALPPLVRIVREVAQLLYAARALPAADHHPVRLAPLEARETWRRTFRLAMFDWAKGGILAIGSGACLGGMVAGLVGAVAGLAVMGASVLLIALPSVLAASVVHGAAARGVDELDARMWLRTGAKSLSAGAVAVLPDSTPDEGWVSSKPSS